MPKAKLRWILILAIVVSLVVGAMTPWKSKDGFTYCNEADRLCQ
jgi:hypothetical protein